jgi:acyl-CoA hydrolase
MCQVSSESVGLKHISGTGGQLDFVRGAYESKGGKGILAFTSTYKDKNGKLQSRILPYLIPGTVVTVPRTDVHWLVTENGKVNMKGRSVWARTEQLINLAHPDLRDDLIREADQMAIWKPSNRIS